MKTSRLLVALLILILLHGCTPEAEDTSLQSTTKLTFSLSASSAPNGRKQSSEIENVTAVSISLTTKTGEAVLTHQRVNVMHFGGQFITEPLELAPGHYVITDFFLLGESSDVLYATPHKRTALAEILNNPARV